MSKPKQILVGGCGSSGTTLLAKILNSHPEIYCGDELSIFDRGYLYHEGLERVPDMMRKGHFLDVDRSMPFPIQYSNGKSYFGLAEWSEPVRKLGWVSYSELIEMVEGCKDVGELGDKLFAPAIKREKKEIWAEKSPGNVFFADHWLDAYPEGRVIIMMRDPFDTIASLMFNRGFNPYAAVTRWIISASAIEVIASFNRVTLVPYEDLTASPELVLTKLARRLDIPDSFNIEDMDIKPRDTFQLYRDRISWGVLEMMTHAVTAQELRLLSVLDKNEGAKL